VLSAFEGLAGDPDGQRVADTVGQALGLCSGTASTEEIGAAVRTLFERVAVERPLVVVFDDIHWAQAAFLDLLRRCGATVYRPVLIVCLARPDLRELRPDWEVAMTLAPLGPPEAHALIRALAGPAPEAAERRIATAAGGNPLFIAQLVALAEQRSAHDGYAHGGPGGDAARLPVSLNVLFTARLDRLPPAERAAAERASVEGGTFHVGGVCAVWPEAPPERIREEEGESDAVVAVMARAAATPLTPHSHSAHSRPGRVVRQLTDGRRRRREIRVRP
jgi:predicted ATPase